MILLIIFLILGLIIGLFDIVPEKYMDKMEVQVELLDGAILDSYSNLEKLANEIRHKIRTVLQIDVKVTLLNPKTLERTAGKSHRVIDRRSKSF